MTSNTDPVRVGVVGVGSMGKHHARIYSSLSDAELVGIVDADDEQAQTVADEYGTDSYGFETLLEGVDAISIAVPTEHHADYASQCLDADVDILVEKPFVDDLEDGKDLVRRAEQTDCVLQVGHIERYNPAVRTLADIAPDLDIIAVNAERLGPPRDRTIEDSAILDLMIHDLDIVLAMLEDPPTAIQSAGVRENSHATATLSFGNDTVVNLTASRLTQKKVRTLEVVAEEAFVTVDYTDRSVEIHRQSTPEFITKDDDLRYRHESVVERPMVGNGEPLAKEIECFLDSVRTREEPKISGEDGLQALYVANRIERLADPDWSDADLPSDEPDGTLEVSLD
jgi:predicted dehydrogenase